MNSNPIASLVEGVRSTFSPKTKDERDQHPAAVPIASPEEIAAARAKGIDLRGRVKPFDRYGRRRVFDVAHHTRANRAERRAVAKSRGVRMAPGFNKPYVRGDA